MNYLPTKNFGSCLVILGFLGILCESHGDFATAKNAGFEFQGCHQRIITVQPGNNRFTVLCFLGTECPLAKLYVVRLNQFADKYRDRDVQFIGMNSNRQDSMEELRAYHKTFKLTFPIGKDYGNVIADRFQVQRTPEVLVLDEKLAVKYRGRIDDQYAPGLSKSKPTTSFLSDAIDSLLVNQSVSIPETKPVGCIIGRVKQAIESSDVTYCDQVSRILQKNCVECHRPGEIGPFALTDYEEVVGWADMIWEVIEEKRMPPWGADSEHGVFANARIMSNSDKNILKSWVDAGAPYGDPKNLPEPAKFVDGWSLPSQPDFVVPMRNRAFHVPADETVEYQYFVIDPQFEEDKWVRAAQVIPGNRAVVHHSIVFIRPPDGQRFRGVGWLAAYVPGQKPISLPAGYARFIPAGSKLVFQQHYTPNGIAQDDVTKVGMVFTDAKDVTHELTTIIGIEQEFEIPPGETNHEVKVDVRGIPKHGHLHAVSPHMHLRGKSFRLYMNNQQENQLIVHVPRYDFNWQHSYQFKTPIPLDEIKHLHFVASFDNSEHNPANPDPKEFVAWGDQTWEEMAVAFFDISQPLNVEGHSTALAENTPQKQQSSQKVDQFVQNFFAKFDDNEDGFVQRDETPISFRSFGFWNFDNNGDAKLSRDEITQAAQQRLP